MVMITEKKIGFVDFDGGRQNSVQPVTTARVRWMTR